MDDSSLKKGIYEIARSILGNDFIGPEEIANSYGISYSKRKLHYLLQTIPPERLLRWCRENGFLLIAGSPLPMSLLDIRHLNPQLFYSKNSGWYEGGAQNFSRDDKITTEWYILRKTLVHHSLSKTWSEQQRLLSPEEFIPNASEIAWIVTSFQRIRCKRYLEKIYTRTSSVDSDADRVIVGSFGNKGLKICDYENSSSVDCVGILSAIRNLTVDFKQAS